MAVTNRDRIEQCLHELRDGLVPFVERYLQAVWGANWANRLDQSSQYPSRKNSRGDVDWDSQLLLKTMFNNWNEAFSEILGHVERSYVSELRTVRNNFAHEKTFSSDDTLRALDTSQRLLSAISASSQARNLESTRIELMRTVFDEQARQKTRRTSQSLKTDVSSGLKPWREVVTPHSDVISDDHIGQAQFAADLAQVHCGEGEPEYKNPVEFYQRTYLTQGLSHLLKGALRRLSSGSGDPVVELQTNFGGGKTHSMLALYHLFSGISATTLSGVDSMLGEIGISDVPLAKRAVLVGTALSPGQPTIKSDGTKINTLWGELAWQLGSADGYMMVADSDKNGTSPGSILLTKLLNEFGPALILIDEWVAFVRQLYSVNGLPAGSFDANLTFAQSLTEAVKATKNALVVASLPASDIEIGGEGGRQALDRLQNTFGRVESTWKPASAQEGFEIVRRRLIEPITEQNHFAERDAVIQSFSRLYQNNKAEFPLDCSDVGYREQMKKAYPIHPELFMRLYDDWGSLDRFQRTRGVLRLMAAAIRALWETGDTSLLIMPANIPIDSLEVKHELTRYMSDPWDAVISKDIDGINSTPQALDREIPNLGRLSATRRVARTIYMGSAPTFQENNPGIDDRSIRIGSVQPGEPIGIFGDALRRLADRATFLYVDGNRHWFSTKPSVSRLADDRAAQIDVHEIWRNLNNRLQTEGKHRGNFSAVHVAPNDSSDVPDDMEARLVILGAEQTHTKGESNSPARKVVEEILANRGNSQRFYRNALVYLAPDKQRIKDLEHSTRQLIAWHSILRDRESLNLTVFQINQADTRKKQAEDDIKTRTNETWIWCIVPSQSNPQSEIEWTEIRLQGQDTLATRASNKLVHGELLITEMGPVRLKMELDKYLWENTNHLNITKLWEYLASYLYLARLKDRSVLFNTIHSEVGGLVCSNFAYAGNYNEDEGRYEDLILAHGGSVVIDSLSVLVKPHVAQRQVEEDRRQQKVEPEVEPTPTPPIPPIGIDDIGSDTAEPTESNRPTRFFGSVELDSSRPVQKVGKVADEVLQHLTTLNEANVTVSLEIHAEIPQGVSEDLQRTVIENCKALKFLNHGFEEK